MSLRAHNMGTVHSSVVVAIFLYDVILTFDHEVAYIWTAARARSGASLLFYANKWITILVSVMELTQFASFPSDKVSSFALYLAYDLTILRGWCISLVFDWSETGATTDVSSAVSPPH